jgi:hypothetical protein
VNRQVGGMLDGHMDVAEAALEPIVPIDGVGPGRMEDEVDGADRLVQGVRDGKPRLHDGRIGIALTLPCARPEIAVGYYSAVANVQIMVECRLDLGRRKEATGDAERALGNSHTLYQPFFRRGRREDLAAVPLRLADRFRACLANISKLLAIRRSSCLVVGCVSDSATLRASSARFCQ